MADYTEEKGRMAVGGAPVSYGTINASGKPVI